jgi:hypothetical protein
MLLPSTLVIQNLPSRPRPCPRVVGSIFISKVSEQSRLGPWTIVVLTQLAGRGMGGRAGRRRLDQRAPSTCLHPHPIPSQGRSVCANQIFASLGSSTTRCEVLTCRFAPTPPHPVGKPGPMSRRLLETSMRSLLLQTCHSTQHPERLITGHEARHNATNAWSSTSIPSHRFTRYL